MRVAVDDSAAFNQGAGIGRYARNLIPAAFAALSGASFTLFYAPEPDTGAPFAGDAVARFSDRHRIRIRRAPLDRRRMDQLWFRVGVPVPIQFWIGRHDLIYSPDFTAPPALRTPRIVTIHDLAFDIVPERAPESLRRYLSSVVPRQVEEAAAIVAVSETTKRDLNERMGIASERVTVIPNAADERFFSAERLSPSQRSALRLPDKYLLTVGTIEPRKNHTNLLAALDLVPTGSRIPLVIAGRVGWSANDILDRIAPLQQAGRVILLDYVDDAILPGLYASAVAVIYPSWYEGFGLPVLEGLASGSYVIASDVPAHHEVAGEEATFVAPGDPYAIADAITAAATRGSPEISVIEARRNQARRTSWSASGTALARLFCEVVST